MDNALVSVIIPVYNTPKEKLAHCMESVIGQTYVNLEIILVDDGSENDIADEVERYTGVDDRVRTVHTKNSGLSLARANGISASAGEYIFFLDSDDVISLDAVECLICAIKETNADLALGRLAVVSEYPKPAISGKDCKVKTYDTLEALERMITCNGIGSTACCRLAKREIWGKTPFLPGRLHEDLASMWEVFSRCERIAVCEKELYFYYHGGQSSIHSKKNSQKFCADFWKAFYERRERLLKQYPQMKQADSFSCLVYCPQIWSSVYHSTNRTELKAISRECVKTFNASWKDGKKYARLHNLKWMKYVLFRISPIVYDMAYSVLRKLKGIRK